MIVLWVIGIIIASVLVYSTIGFLVDMAYYMVTGDEDLKPNEMGVIIIIFWPLAFVYALPYMFYKLYWEKTFKSTRPLPARRRYRQQQAEMQAIKNARELDKIYNEHPEWKVNA